MLKWINKQIVLLRLNQALKETMKTMKPIWDSKSVKGFWNEENAAVWNRLEGRRLILGYAISYYHYFDEMPPGADKILTEMFGDYGLQNSAITTVIVVVMITIILFLLLPK